MDLHNSFEVPCGVDDAWPLLLDVERIAPCLPGAQLDEIDGGDHRGTVKVKIGPITANYKGTAVFVERDDEAHRVVISASGRDARGAGSADAVITARLEALAEERTQVTVDTELQIKGKVAQFGRGMIAEVSANLMGQFATNLETLLTGEEAASEDVAADGPSVPEPATGDSSDPVDLLAHAAVPVAKRLVPIVIATIVVVALRRWWSSCRRTATEDRNG